MRSLVRSLIKKMFYFSGCCVRAIWLSWILRCVRCTAAKPKPSREANFQKVQDENTGVATALMQWEGNKWAGSTTLSLPSVYTHSTPKPRCIFAPQSLPWAIGSPYLCLPGTTSSVDLGDNVERSFWIAQSLALPRFSLLQAYAHCSILTTTTPSRCSFSKADLAYLCEKKEQVSAASVGVGSTCR